MKRVAKVLLLYENRTWVEIDIITALREIPLDTLYQLIPDKYKTRGLMKIHPLGFKGHYSFIDLRPKP